MYSLFVSHLVLCSTEEDQICYMLPILYRQYHAYRCPGNLRSQGVSRYGIDQISQNIPSLVWEKLIQLLSSMYNSSIISSTLDHDFKNTNQTFSLYIAAGANWQPFCRRCFFKYILLFENCYEIQKCQVIVDKGLFTANSAANKDIEKDILKHLDTVFDEAILNI